MQLALQSLGGCDVFIKVGVNLLHERLLRLGYQFGLLFINPVVQFITCFGEFFHIYRIVIAPIAIQGAVQLAEKVSKLIRDAEAFGIHLIQLRPQVARLLLGFQGHEGDGESHQPDGRCESDQPECDASIHRRVLINYSAEHTG